VALVGKPGLVVDAKATARKRQDIKVPDVRGLDVGVPQPSGFSAAVREASAFEPVLLGGGPAVVGRATVGQLAHLKGEAMNWLDDPNYAALQLRLENAHAAVEAATVEARRRVRLNEGR
jgi:hypothetical protein